MSDSMRLGASSRARWETVVGLEVHVQLRTRGKLFAPVPADYAPDAPNTRISPYCVGLPGTLPRLDGEAVRMAVRTALALECRVAQESRFDRKHYFYPDLPKGYQITQAEHPLATRGRLEVPADPPTTVRIVRLHLEEDAGKVVAQPSGRVGLDYNRAGVPLVEIVTAPDLRSGAEAAEALRELRAILTTLGVSDGSLEQGSLRCDVNVSVRRKGTEPLGVRCEIKNVSGFRFVAQAVEAEAARQIATIEHGHSVRSETRGFDASRRETFALRSKESAPDYRYLPEPDLGPLRLDPETIAGIAASLPELPAARRRRWMELGLPPDHAVVFAAEPAWGDLFDAATQAEPDLAIAIGDLMKTTLLGRDDGAGKLDPRDLASLARLKEAGTVSSTQQKAMLRQLADGRAPSVDAALEAAGGPQVGARELVDAWIDAVIAAHPEPVARFRAGKSSVLGFLVGQVMRASGGRANPRAVSQRLAERLDTSNG